MFAKIITTLVLLVVTTMVQVSRADTSFIFNYGFQSANLIMDGFASVTSNGLLILTNQTQLKIGHAFYPNPLVFTNTSSFSTTFVFAIRPQYPNLGGHGMTFVISPTTTAFKDAVRPPYLGLFNEKNNGNSTNHVFAVELDTNQNTQFDDIDDNHIGIDINSLKSKKSAVGWGASFRR